MATTNGSDGVKYTKAATSEAEATTTTNGGTDPVDVEYPDKSRTTCMQKCALYSCFLGFVFILAGLIW